MKPTHQRTIADYVAFCDDMSAATKAIMADLGPFGGADLYSFRSIIQSSITNHFQPVLRKHCRRADPEIECAS